ncbi:MAG: hypothetical protein Q9190_006381 [Brigantiaea leucoxantha]
MTFCDWFAGATQVKWNRQDSHILASSHDKFLRIWDDRKGAYPLRSIEAHATKIYGVDWNRVETNSLATCSLDKTIKFWDYNSDTDLPKEIIRTPFPVWRARYTPFGSGLLAMPQRGDFDLHLFKRGLSEQKHTSDDTLMVHRFEGHKDQVKEFLWRPRGTLENSIDDREFQLVTWGADKMLRLHRLDDKILKKVGYEKGKEVQRTIPLTRKHATYKTFHEIPSAPQAAFPTHSTRPGINSIERQIGSGMRSLLSLGISGAPIGLGNSRIDGNVTTSMTGRKERAVHDMDPISWMKGVQIGKRGTDRSVAQQQTSSILSPTLKTDRIWDTFESLADEITHVADKFRRVTFEVSLLPASNFIHIEGKILIALKDQHAKSILDRFF